MSMAANTFRVGARPGARPLLGYRGFAPTPAMAQGGRANVTPAELEKIRHLIGEAVQALDYEMWSVLNEFSDLILEDAPGAVPFLETWPEDQVLTQLTLVAGQIRGRTSDLLRDARGYMTGPQVADAETVVLTASDFIGSVPAEDQAPIAPENESAATDHMESHLDHPIDVVRAAQTEIARAEGSALPIEETANGRNGSTFAVAAVAALTIGAFILFG